MWNVTGSNLSMVEGDWGIILPVEIGGITFSASDEIKITIKKELNGDPLIEKVYSNITQNTVNLEFTEAESELLPVGVYVYSLDWYQDGAFMCNIIDRSSLKVVDKA